MDQNQRALMLIDFNPPSNDSGYLKNAATSAELPSKRRQNVPCQLTLISSNSPFGAIAGQAGQLPKVKCKASELDYSGNSLREWRVK